MSNLMVHLDSPYMICYWCLIVIHTNSASLQDAGLRNLNDLHLDFSRSPKIEYNDAVGVPVFNLIVSKSNIWLNSVPLQDTSFRYLSDLEFNRRSKVMVQLYSPYMTSY